ncbi:MAG: hypothetical protein WAX77_03845 [Methylococcaceae bacterium]
MRYQSENLAQLLIAPFQAVLHDVQNQLSAQIDVERLEQQETVSTNDAQAVVQSAKTAIKLNPRFAQDVTPPTPVIAETFVSDSFSDIKSTPTLVENKDTIAFENVRAVALPTHSSNIALRPFIASHSNVSSEAVVVPTIDAVFAPTLATLTPPFASTTRNAEALSTTRAIVTTHALSTTESLSVIEASTPFAEVSVLSSVSLPLTAGTAHTGDSQTQVDANNQYDTEQATASTVPPSALFASQSIATSHLAVSESLVPTAKVEFHAVRQTVNSLQAETARNLTSQSVITSPTDSTFSTDAPVVTAKQLKQTLPTAVFIPLRSKAITTNTRQTTNEQDLPSTLRQRFSSAVEPALQQAYQVTQQQLPEEESNTPAELNTNQSINNTFNVSVAMSQDKQNSVLDLNQFEQALTDVLRTAARRHGLEV